MVLQSSQGLAGFLNCYAAESDRVISIIDDRILPSSHHKSMTESSPHRTTNHRDTRGWMAWITTSSLTLLCLGKKAFRSPDCYSAESGRHFIMRTAFDDKPIPRTPSVAEATGIKVPSGQPLQLLGHAIPAPWGIPFPFVYPTLAPSIMPDERKVHPPHRIITHW